MPDSDKREGNAPSPFERFQNVARKLIVVPKEELDGLRKKHAVNAVEVNRKIDDELTKKG